MSTQSHGQTKANWDHEAIDLPGAHQTLFSRRKVKVAIIDTGINEKHPEFKNKIVLNFNSVFNNTDSRDDNGHGTHIAGIVSQVAKNSAELIIIKYYEPRAPFSDSIKSTAKAIRYAVDQGAEIINYSAGGMRPHIDEEAAIRYAEKKDVLVIAAAGNHGQNTLNFPYYPAAYDLNNIISVSSIGIDNKLLPSSNYGPKVHVSAPGFMIRAPAMSGGYQNMTGTSQATAIVSGIAALVAAQSLKRLPLENLKEQIIMTAKNYEGVKIVNAERALSMLSPNYDATNQFTESTSHDNKQFSMEHLDSYCH
jgi:subtilisin family serine protease